MTSDKYASSVGFFALTAIIILLYGWGWLKSFSLFHPPQRITVQFHDVAGLNNNATVNINGVRVGVVEKLELKGKGDVLVGLKINTESLTIPKGSKFTIQTLGLVGAKYVEITLPETAEGSPQPEPIGSEIVAGEDPVRVELVVNKIATNLAKIDYASVGDKLSKDLEQFGSAAEQVKGAASRFGDVADNAKGASGEAKEFFKRGTRSFDQIDSLASSLKGSTSHINLAADSIRSASGKAGKILDNPALSSDLKETAEKARQTADKINDAIQSLTSTLTNEPLRADLIKSLDKLNASTENIYKSVNTIHQIAGDQGLREDVRATVSDAKQAMQRLDNVMSQPEFGTDLKSTIAQVKKTASHVDLAARQLSQILEKKHPLIQMLVGRPGYISEKSGNVEPKDKTKPRAGGDVPQEQQPVIVAPAVPEQPNQQ